MDEAFAITARTAYVLAGVAHRLVENNVIGVPFRYVTADPATGSLDVVAPNGRTYRLTLLEQPPDPDPTPDPIKSCDRCGQPLATHLDVLCRSGRSVTATCDYCGRVEVPVGPGALLTRHEARPNVTCRGSGLRAGPSWGSAICHYCTFKTELTPEGWFIDHDDPAGDVCVGSGKTP
jgi:hypothetical protein